ncbi:MAG TPA: hypothetical protein VF449_07620 [Parvibaculum sp.]
MSERSEFDDTLATGISRRNPLAAGAAFSLAQVLSEPALDRGRS